MEDMEAGLAKFLEGKFFWTPNCRPDSSDSVATIEIRKIQKSFYKNAKVIFSGTVAAEALAPKIRRKSFNVKNTHILNAEAREKLLPILKAVSVVYDVDASSILDKSTNAISGLVKGHFYWAVKNAYPYMTYSHIGRLIGKDHSTILHGYNRFEKNKDPEKIRMVEEEMGVE